MCRYSVTPIRELSEGFVSNLQEVSLDAGVYSMFSISEKWCFGGKALVGTWLKGNCSLDLVLGVNLGWRYSSRYTLKLFADFDSSKRKISFQEEQSGNSFSALKRLSTITLGSSFAIGF